MKRFKSVLKDLVGTITLGNNSNLSICGVRICYGQEKYIIKVCKLLEICANPDLQLSVEGLLSACSHYSDISYNNIIGEIRLVDSIHNEIGFFTIEEGVNRKNMFGGILYNNLMLIDVGMPVLLTEAVTIAKSKGIVKVSEIYKNILVSNPLEVANDWIEITYRFKIGRLLYDFAIGLTEESVWQGDTPTGGIVFIVNGVSNGFNYFDQTAIGNFLIGSTKLTIDGTHYHFKLSSE